MDRLGDGLATVTQRSNSGKTAVKQRLDRLISVAVKCGGMEAFFGPTPYVLVCVSVYVCVWLSAKIIF